MMIIDINMKNMFMYEGRDQLGRLIAQNFWSIFMENFMDFDDAIHANDGLKSWMELWIFSIEF